MIETAPRNVEAPAKRVVLSHGQTVPDFAKGLTTSSIVLRKASKRLRTDKQRLMHKSTPYAFGVRGLRRHHREFPKSSELLFLFLIYNEGAAAGDKPISTGPQHYFGDQTKPFGKLAPASFNAKTLPRQNSA